MEKNFAILAKAEIPYILNITAVMLPQSGERRNNENYA